MIISNIHTHTTFSDGISTPEEVVEYAIRKGLLGLGFSDHGYTDFDLSYCMKDIKAYKDKIRFFTDKYKNQIDIFLGVERDFYSDEDINDYDYVIGSLHYIYSKGEYYSVDNSAKMLIKCLDFAFGGNETDMVKAYYDKLVEAAIKTKPDVLGHFDVITKFGLINEESDVYRRTAREALDALIDTGVIFEVNTGAMARGYKSMPYPAKEHLQRIFERGARVLVGSDCHDAKMLCYGFDFTSQLLYEIGFRSVTVLKKNGFCQVPIEN